MEAQLKAEKARAVQAETRAAHLESLLAAAESKAKEIKAQSVKLASQLAASEARETYLEDPLVAQDESAKVKLKTAMVQVPHLAAVTSPSLHRSFENIES